MRKNYQKKARKKKKINTEKVGQITQNKMVKFFHIFD